MKKKKTEQVIGSGERTVLIEKEQELTASVFDSFIASGRNPGPRTLDQAHGEIAEEVFPIAAWRFEICGCVIHGLANKNFKVGRVDLLF